MISPQNESLLKLHCGKPLLCTKANVSDHKPHRSFHSYDRDLWNICGLPDSVLGLKKWSLRTHMLTGKPHSRQLEMVGISVRGVTPWKPARADSCVAQWAEAQRGVFREVRTDWWLRSDAVVHQAEGEHGNSWARDLSMCWVIECEPSRCLGCLSRRLERQAGKSAEIHLVPRWAGH